MLSTVTLISALKLLRFARHETEVGPEGKISIFFPNVPKFRRRWNATHHEI